jgi:hypothetical protein
MKVARPDHDCPGRHGKAAPGPHWQPSRSNAPPWPPKSRRIETEAAPIRYVAELVGADTDSERAIRWLIALMVLCCDPLAIALTAAVSARRSPL